MPCYDGRDCSYEEEIKNRLDEVTRILCDIMKALEGMQASAPFLDNITGLKQWWSDHKAWDEKREAREI